MAYIIVIGISVLVGVAWAHSIASVKPEDWEQMMHEWEDDE